MEDTEEDQEWDEEMAKRRRRSNSYEDTIKNMDPDLVRELGLSEGEGTSEDERDTASRIEDRANEKAANGGVESNGNGARRRSRSRSRSRPPNLETVEENYSKEYQGGNISKTDGSNNFSSILLWMSQIYYVAKEICAQAHLADKIKYTRNLCTTSKRDFSPRSSTTSRSAPLEPPFR